MDPTLLKFCFLLLMSLFDFCLFVLTLNWFNFKSHTNSSAGKRKICVTSLKHLVQSSWMGNEWQDSHCWSWATEFTSSTLRNIGSRSHVAFLVRKAVSRQDSTFIGLVREKCVGCFSSFHQIPVKEKWKGINSVVLQQNSADGLWFNLTDDPQFDF